MLIARAPLRISLAGGGTDLPAYYEEHGGLVISTTIDKFVYARVASNASRSAQIVSADYQTSYLHGRGTPMCWDGDLSLPRAVLHEMDLHDGVSVFLASEVPPGTGLGSSSAMAVALVQVLAMYRDAPLTRQQVADLACRIEIEKLSAPIGKQDQYAAAFGGLNAIQFERGGVKVEPVRTPPGLLDRLSRRLVLFFTGTARSSATILRAQQAASASGDPQALAGLHQIRGLATVCRGLLEQGDVDAIGELLHEGWMRKRSLTSGITTGQIDELYDTALAHGALGGKITGAGGGGFLLLYCRQGRKADVISAMTARGLRQMDFCFEPRGVLVSSLNWQDTEEFGASRASA
ncbi:MAG: GHMP kinase [Chloroflexi bacterium]|nr:GHMP kinase [Chloroflexota bacterium]